MFVMGAGVQVWCVGKFLFVHEMYRHHSSAAVQHMSQLARRSSLSGNRSVKFVHRCEVPTGEWLWIDKLLHQSSDETGVLLGNLMIPNKRVVLKFGKPSALRHEYSVGEKLQTIPNFMRYYCFFTCNERATDLFRRNYGAHSRICEKPGDQLVLSMMPYYSLGPISRHRWDRTNLPNLKAVVKQVVTALLVSYRDLGFVHGDMHLDNILLRATQKRGLVYATDLRINTLGMYAIIMDFEKSSVNDERDQPWRAYDCTSRLLHLVASMDENSDMALEFNTGYMTSLVSKNTPITNDIIRTIWDVVDNMSIRYEKSKLPPNPFSSLQRR